MSTADVALLKRADAERAAILRIARKHDAEAEWNSDAPDENCLLVSPDAVVFLLDRYPDAYDDPNPPGWCDHTRVVFPTMTNPDA